MLLKYYATNPPISYILLSNAITGYLILAHQPTPPQEAPRDEHGAVELDFLLQASPQWSQGPWTCTDSA